MDKKSKPVRKKTLTFVYKESIFVNMRYHVAYQLLMLLGTFIGCLVLGCSNSDGIENDAVAFLDIEDDATPLSTETDYLPLDDSEYPYAGIPRIVIETENHREIIDRETEIPAKLQIWGENAPESEIMDLTIRGRGNSTWGYPKKPYAIKFNEKQAFLGMPKAKKWVMLANYRDRTLIRNALAFEIARQTSQAWVPQGRFVDVYLNKEFIGNYYICEKIEIKENRLNLDTNGFLLKFDTHYNDKYKFKSIYKNLPINIKYPDSISEEKLNLIQNYINSIENALYADTLNDSYKHKLDIKSLASYWIIQEITQNLEAIHPKSVHAYKDTMLKFGPIWDFDWQTFTTQKKGLGIRNALWLSPLREKKEFIEAVKQEWNNCKNNFFKLEATIDSLAYYTRSSNEHNITIWPIKITEGTIGDEDKDFSTAISMMKNAFISRLEELDQLFNAQ